MHNFMNFARSLASPSSLLRWGILKPTTKSKSPQNSPIGSEDLARSGKGIWVDELHHVLWTYQMIQRIPIEETSFNLAFGIEVVFPIKIGLPSFRVEKYNENTNSEWLRANLDLLEENREHATMRIACNHHRMARYYNARVKTKGFKVDDLVL